jgi:prepilin-type N-terminal cleavage/methylation domain-containing protein/prepilin-type processing-associated H-X9-DG protein
MKLVYRRAKQSTPAGFTLVELLIVISIIGVLVALLMPAINAARESGRRAQCGNNLHQMALGCLQHEAKLQYLPTGGWGCIWGGEADRGFGATQPGGWHYNILPFIDQSDLHDMDKGLSRPGDAPGTQNARYAAGTKIAETIVPLFLCPTRSKVKTSPDNYPHDFLNINPYPNIARSDYAANAGSSFTTTNTSGFPQDYPTPTNPVDWSKYNGTINSSIEKMNGVIFRASALSTAAIKDGATYTYMIGERYLCPDAYNVGPYQDNDQGWDQGYDYDTIRGTMLPPAQDRTGACGIPNSGSGGSMQYMIIFGSPHTAGFNMAFCDGSVRKMNYSIDPALHKSLGDRADGQPTQLQQLNDASTN